MKSIRLQDSQYPLIYPLLLCSIKPLPSQENTDLSERIKSFVDKRIAEGRAENISALVISYKEGWWAGVNQDENYDPASLLKVPLAIAYYQWAETNPAILSEKFSFNGTDQNTNEYFKSPNDIKPGITYSTNDLIYNMLVNSDNTAEILLEKFINPKILSRVYTNLGLSIPPQDSTVPFISVNQYAYFFRVLFSATYLDRNYSEKALELLELPDFPQGIEAGLPANIKYAQKFGERTIYTGTVLTDRELHDCGIIYKPDSPFLLCIMSRGTDFNQLAKNIRDLTAFVYPSL